MGFQLTRRTLLGLYAALVVIPLVVVVSGTFKTTQELFSSPFGPPASLDLTNYRTVLGEQDLAGAFRNSLLVTVTSVLLTLLLGSLAAFGVSRIVGWRGLGIYGLLVLGLAVPAQANMIPQFVLFDALGLTDSLVGLVLINIVIGLPVTVFILTGFMRTLPREIFEAAAVDGANPWRLYRSIVMPLSLPSLGAATIFLFVIQWNELLHPLLFIRDPGKRTLPLALLEFQGEYLTDYPLLFAGVLVASAPIVLAYLFLQRFFVAGMTAGAVKG